MGLSDILSGGSGLFGDIINQVLQHGAQQKRTADINQILNRQVGDYGLGRDLVFGTGNGTPGLFSNLADPALTDRNRQLQYLYGGDNGGAFGSLNDLINGIYNPGSVSSAYGGADPYGQNIPGLQSVLEQLQGGLPQLQGQSALANQVFSGGGWTPQSQTSFDNLSSFFGGQNPQQQALGGMANNIFNSNGQSQNPLFQSILNSSAQGITGTNPLLQGAAAGANSIIGNQGQTGPTNAGIGAAQNLFANGGMTPALQSLLGVGSNVLSQNGLTPTGAQGESAALKVLNNGGATPTTNALQGRGVDLANRESLLPLDLATSMARNDAATTFQNNMEAARRQALSRGGGAGSTVASGLQNQGLADYSDRGAQTEAQAVRDTLDKQQQLQLQQAGLGAQMAQQGGNLENSRFGTAASTLGNLEDVASRRFSTGGNFITGASNAATNNASTGLGALQGLTGLQSQRELAALGLLPQISQTGTNQAGVYGNLYNASNAQNLDALGLGRNMYNDVLNSDLGANSQYNNLIGTQGQYALGAGNLANAGQNDISGILQAILGGNLSASGQGLNRTNSAYNVLGQGIGSLQGQQNFSGRQQNNANSGLNSLLNTILQWSTGNGQRADVTAFQNAHPGENPWGPILGNLGSSLASWGAGQLGSGGNTSTTTLNYPGMPKP